MCSLMPTLSMLKDLKYLAPAAINVDMLHKVKSRLIVRFIDSNIISYTNNLYHLVSNIILKKLIHYNLGKIIKERYGTRQAVFLCISS